MHPVKDLERSVGLSRFGMNAEKASNPVSKMRCVSGEIRRGKRSSALLTAAREKKK